MGRIFIILLLVAAVILVGVLYVGPAWKNFVSIRKDTSDLQSLSAEVDQLIQNMNTVGNIITKIDTNDLTRISRAIPQGADTANFLVDLEQLATKNGLALKRTQVPVQSASIQRSAGNQPLPGKGSAPSAVAVDPGALKTATVDFAVSGTYDSFKNFLQDIEHFVRLVSIKQITFTAGQKITDPVEFTLRTEIYYQ